MLLMMCDRCALERELAEGEPGDCRPTGTVEGVSVGCFPDLYGALAGAPPTTSSRCKSVPLCYSAREGVPIRP